MESALLLVMTESASGVLVRLYGHPVNSFLNIRGIMRDPFHPAPSSGSLQQLRFKMDDSGKK